MSELHYLYGKPTGTADLRTVNSDFIVKEILPFSPSGEGEHHLVHIRKDGLNTVQVAEMLAKFAKVHPKEVTYAGQKIKMPSQNSGLAFVSQVKKPLRGAS